MFLLKKGGGPDLRSSDFRVIAWITINGGPCPQAPEKPVSFSGNFLIVM